MFISNYWKGWLKFFERRNNQAIIKNSDMTLFVITVFLNLTQILLPIIVALFLRLFPIAPELAYWGKQKLLSFNMRYYSKAVFFCSFYFFALWAMQPPYSCWPGHNASAAGGTVIKEPATAWGAGAEYSSPCARQTAACFRLRTLFHHSYHYPFRCDPNLPNNPAEPCRAGR